ncbi:hypothetical protein BGW41_005257 [Actinomortierella wolfii]|nr:hypothetical protein BGW41_005257 [Actinomortierella wolfii]
MHSNLDLTTSGTPRLAPLFGNIAQSRLSQKTEDVPLTAVIVPIGRLEPVRTLVSLTIKDEHDTIDVKIWHRSQEHVSHYEWIKLDLVIHVWTDDVKLNTTDTTDTTTVSSTTSPLVMTLSEGKHGHQIVSGSPEEHRTLFKTALDVNAGGIIQTFNLEQLVSAGDALLHQHRRLHLPLLVKRIGTETQVRTRFGETYKRTLTMMDGQGREARLTLWGASMSRSAQDWTANETVLVLTAPKVGMYNQMLDISLGFQTHVQVNPACKTVEWLRHAAPQFNDAHHVNRPHESTEMALENITTFYSILQISEIIPGLSSLSVTYGYTVGVISQLDIEQRGVDLMGATWILGARIQ